MPMADGTVPRMEAMDIAAAAMRERVELQHLAQNVLADTVVIELAQKIVPELPDTIAEWPLESIRELLPLLDTEASRIAPDAFPDLDLSTYDCEQIFRTRIDILQTLLNQPLTHINAWKLSGTLSEIGQKLDRHVTTRHGIQNIAGHFAGLATAAVLAHNDITTPPSGHTEWGDIEEWKELRATLTAARAKVQKEILMGN